MAGVFLFLCSGSNRSCSIISVYDNEAFGDKENIINSDFNGAFAIAKGHSGIDTLLETGFLIIGANGIEYKKILKVYLIVKVPITICTMIAGYTGLITNLVYH